MASRGKVWLGRVWWGVVRFAEVWRGKVRQGAGRIRFGAASSDVVRYG